MCDEIDVMHIKLYKRDVNVSRLSWKERQIVWPIRVN